MSYALNERGSIGGCDRSLILRDRAMDVAKRSHEGTIIMAGDMAQQPIERDIYSYLRARWTLKRFDGMHSVAVLRLRSKD